MVKRWERLRVSARERQIHIGVTTSNVIKAMYTTMETPEGGKDSGCVGRRGGGKCSIVRRCDREGNEVGHNTSTDLLIYLHIRRM